ncbi:MAG: hypothetical protein OXG72_09020 [Acidobacteria bacterium]|nr:hypothetical protein [Acidobacteriota bacterium]
MSLDFDIDLEIPDVNSLVEQERHEITANLAHELERGIRKRDTLWPQDTGFSRDRFRLEDDNVTGDILVLNTAPYAAAVNNRQAYPRGGRNPNYRAAQRAIERLWRKALGKAAG